MSETSSKRSSSTAKFLDTMRARPKAKTKSRGDVDYSTRILFALRVSPQSMEELLSRTDGSVTALDQALARLLSHGWIVLGNTPSGKVASLTEAGVRAADAATSSS